MSGTLAPRHFVTTDPNDRERATGADLAAASISIAAACVVATANTRRFLQIDEAFPLPVLFNAFGQTWHLESREMS
jgi:hypothetical protein